MQVMITRGRHAGRFGSIRGDIQSKFDQLGSNAKALVNFAPDDLVFIRCRNMRSATPMEIALFVTSGGRDVSSHRG